MGEVGEEDSEEENDDEDAGENENELVEEKDAESPLRRWSDSSVCNEFCKHEGAEAAREEERHIRSSLSSSRVSTSSAYLSARCAYPPSPSVVALSTSPSPPPPSSSHTPPPTTTPPTKTNPHTKPATAQIPTLLPITAQIPVSPSSIDNSVLARHTSHGAARCTGGEAPVYCVNVPPCLGAENYVERPGSGVLRDGAEFLCSDEARKKDNARPGVCSRREVSPESLRCLQRAKRLECRAALVEREKEGDRKKVRGLWRRVFRRGE